MSRPRSLRAGSLCVIAATVAASWGCTERFGIAPNLDASSGFDAGLRADLMDAELTGDGPTEEAGTDVSATDSLNPDAGDGSLAQDARSTDDGTIDDSNALDASDGKAADGDAPDGDAGSWDAADAPDAPLPSNIGTSSSVAVTAICNGANGTAPDTSATLTFGNNAAYPITWSAVAAHGSVVAQPSGGTIGGGLFTGTTVYAVALTGYAPGATLSDTLVVTTNDGHAPLRIPVTETFMGYHADTPPIDFGLVPTGTSVTKDVTVTFNGTCCTSASPDAVRSPFTAVSTRSSGTVTSVAITFSPTTAAKFSDSFQFTGASVQVCSPPIMVSGTGN
jgi:hypothetical protein